MSINLVSKAIVIVVALTYVGFPTAVAQEQEEPKQGEEGQAEVASGVAELPGGQVVRVNGKRILVRWRKHGFKKGDRFYVLNNVGTGIVCELEVFKFGKRRKVMFEARVVDNPLRVKLTSLFNAKTIRIDLAKKNATLFPDGPIKIAPKVEVKENRFKPDLFLNPTARLRFATGENRSLAAPLSTDVNLIVPLRSAVLGLDTFLPTLAGARWLNGFGLDFVTDLPRDTDVEVKDSASSVVQQAVLSRERTSVSLLIRPSFESRWLARVGLRVVGLEEITETLKFKATDNNLGTEPTTDTVTISGPRLDFEYEASLFPNFFTGINVAIPLAQTITIESQASGSQKLSGDYTRQDITLQAGSRYGLLGGRPHILTLELQGFYTFRSVEISGIDTDGAKQASTSYQILGALLAVGYLN